MITNSNIKSAIDKLWEEFWTGGITNPLTVIEQISFLMFVRLLDIRETRDEKRASRSKTFKFKPIYLKKEQHLRWQNFKHLPAEKMLELVGDEVFKHFKKRFAGDHKLDSERSAVERYMADVTFMIQKPALLQSAVDRIDKLPLATGDTKGDFYEYLLSKLTTAGINGQFRTPRHIIAFMVKMLEPKPSETVCDPSCGTAGFLVETMKYLLEKNTSKDAVIVEKDDEGNKHKVYSGNELTPGERKFIQNKMFNGYDFDATMLRIAAMNLMLHGVENPAISYMDTLSNSFPEKQGKFAADAFDVILANPPFKGSLDAESVSADLLRKVKTKKTELLFLVLILRMLKDGGRSATIVPDGVLFGSSKAHKAVRQLLVDENQLEAVISLPSGVFKPYAGVSTAILVFTKGGETKDVFFYDVKGDGFSLDDKREAKPETDDLPLALKAYFKRSAKRDTDRTKPQFMVPVSEIRENGFDLSINRYKEVVYEAVQYDPPGEIIDRLVELEGSILKDLEELRGML